MAVWKVEKRVDQMGARMVGELVGLRAGSWVLMMVANLEVVTVIVMAVK